MNLQHTRTIHFIPATQLEAIESVRNAKAGGVIIDLEDTIPLSEKDAARQQAIQYFQTRQHSPQGFFVGLRMNSITNTTGLKDILAVIEANINPDIIVLPKTESIAEIKIINSLFLPKIFPYLVLIETPAGIRDMDAIAASCSNICALALGGGDLAADLGSEQSWDALLTSRTLMIRAAAIAHIAAFDAPFNPADLDKVGLKVETQKSKALGFSGRLTLEIDDIAVINQVFHPSQAEVEAARRIITAYQNSHQGICKLDGKIINIHTYKKAEELIANYAN